MKMNTRNVCSVACFICVLQLAVLRSENVPERNEKEKRILLNDPNLINSQMEALKREVQTLTSQLSNLQSTYQSKFDNLQSTYQSKFDNLQSTYQSNIDNLQSTQQSEMTLLRDMITQSNHGTTYIIWGKKTCPSINGTSTVYSGISGGRDYTISGSGTNTLCLPHNPDPTPSDYPKAYQNSGFDAWGTIYGAEYQFTYRNIAVDDDVPCAVCLLTHASTMMIPAKTACPTGWTTQYSGVLTTEDDDHHGSDFLCLDGNPEYMTEGSRMKDYNGKLFYPVRAVCGSLPCPPYSSHQLVSCVVCSK
ncbi:short-chain collagen C4-like [Saccostrea cucullata]|uniref:short-chain collagen C4-like n=1 Tax=Saccostrea cuccullata TaxID=36930 RepID=UPI002ED61447